MNGRRHWLRPTDWIDWLVIAALLLVFAVSMVEVWD